MLRNCVLCLALIICLVTLAPNAITQAQEIRASKWVGTIDANRARLRLEIAIADNDRQLTGQARSLDQGNATFKMTDITMGGKAFSFSLPQVGAQFQGTLSEDGATATGTFRQGQGETPLTLVKKDSDQSGNPTSLADRLLELEKIVQWYVEKERAIGAELQIIQGGVTILHESYGYSDREAERRWENDTICNIRSMTKPITSAAAQILIDQGKLKLDAPVSNYLEGFDNEKSGSITVRQVLTHRSGLPLTNLLSPNQYSSLSEQVAAAGKAGPNFEPGSKFWYSDTGTDVVAALVEQVTGEPLHEFVQREIFEPLEMSNTFYGIDAADERLLQAASLYIKVPKGWFRFWRPTKPLYPFAWGSQTVYSTTTDYARFLGMLMKGGRVGERQVLSPAAVERMLAPVSRMKMLGSDASYPTGFRDVEAWYGQMLVTHRPIGKENERPVVIGHSGSDGTNAWAWPDRDLIILYFTQSRGGMTVLKIEQPIDRLLIHPGEQRVEDVPEHLQPYIGIFTANYEGFNNEQFTVLVRNGKLFLDVPSQMTFELMEPDEHGMWAFAMVPDQVQANFDRNDNDEVIGLRLHREGKIYEVPRKGTPRAEELTRQKQAKMAAQQKQEQEKQAKEKLQAAWVGKLDIGGIKPVMQFRIVTTDAGDTVAYFDSVTEGRTGFEATWSSDGDQLKFDVAKIGLTYRGKLNAEGDTAEGTWSQGGRNLSLTLKKQATEYADK